MSERTLGISTLPILERLATEIFEETGGITLSVCHFIPTSKGLIAINMDFVSDTISISGDFSPTEGELGETVDGQLGAQLLRINTQSIQRTPRYRYLDESNNPS